MKQQASLVLLSILAGISGISAAEAGALVDVTQSQNINRESMRFGAISQNPAEAAKQYLMSQAQVLGLESDLSDLSLASTHETPVGFHVRFQQMDKGLPVDGAGVVVTLDHARQVLTYINDYIPHEKNLYESAAKFSITEDQAAQIVYQELKLTASPSRQEIVQKISVVQGVARPVYQIQISAPVDKKWSWEVLVDANSGKIYRSESKAYDVKDVVSANVFEPNPTIKSGKAYGQVAGYEDNNHGNTPFFESMMTAVTLDNLTKKGNKFTLVGPNVQMADFESPKNPKCEGAKMNYKRSDACFNDVTAYYFLDKTLRYINEKLGFNVHPIKYQGALKADAHGLNGDDNSHYDGASDVLAFGEGGVPDAQDHDVVIHELGHAIHNWITNGQISQVDGLSEGIGDYWAASFDRQFTKPGDVAYHWTFSYDGHNNFWPGRVTNIAEKYPQAVQSGSVHASGQLWATVCMDVYDSLGKEKTDKIHWSAIAMLNRSSGQLDAAKAFVVAARKLYPNEPATIATVITKFKAHGFPVQ